MVVELDDTSFESATATDTDPYRIANPYRFCKCWIEFGLDPQCRLVGEAYQDTTRLDQLADGEVVVVHDSDFMKTARKPLRIWNATRQDLDAIDVGLGCGVEMMSRIGLGANVINGPGSSRTDAFPYDTQVALQYDSGNYEPALDRALALAQNVGRQSPPAVAACKTLIQEARGGNIEAAYAVERAAFVDLFDTKDQAEGVNAFLEKRAPEWVNG